ncbi:unannotated protein [freshwater metagenome]|uniref:Unannotated protein n=1 Tax=freshwater metagenome TaxID=449393 RepID=A0A6J7XQV9_9ZZZZ
MTRSTPFESHISRKPARYPTGGVTTPASPIIGSTITIAIFFVTAFFMALRSPKGTCLTSLSNGRNGVLFEGCPVSESAPIVLPWNAPWVATIFLRPLRRESLSAASFASAPELQKNILACESLTMDCKALDSSRTLGWL